MSSRQAEWHLDRKITMGIIASILLNVGSSVWWAASLNSQVLTQQKAIDQQAVQIASIMASQSGVSERLAKMEAGITYQSKTLDRIEDRLKGK